MNVIAIILLKSDLEIELANCMARQQQSLGHVQQDAQPCSRA